MVKETCDRINMPLIQPYGIDIPYTTFKYLKTHATNRPAAISPRNAMPILFMVLISPRRV
jgi:hypothetical protein